MCRLRKYFSQKRCGSPQLLPSMARPGSKASSRAAHVIGQGTVFRRALCLFWYSAVTFLTFLIIVEHGGATYSLCKLCSLFWLRARSQTWERPGKCTRGHRDPPGDSGHLVRDLASQATTRTPLSPSLGLQWSLLPELVASPTESSLLCEKHHKVYTGSFLTPDLLCAGSHLPSSGIPAPGHLCELHTLFVSRLTALELTSDTPKLLSSWPLPWFAGSWAAFFFFFLNKILMLSFLSWQPGSPQMRSHTSMTLKKYENRTL